MVLTRKRVTSFSTAHLLAKDRSSRAEKKKKSQDSFKQNDCIILVLLYGGVSFPFAENTSLLNTSVEYMTTKRFDTPLMIDS